MHIPAIGTKITFRIKDAFSGFIYALIILGSSTEFVGKNIGN